MCIENKHKILNELFSFVHIHVVYGRRMYACMCGETRCFVVFLCSSLSLTKKRVSNAFYCRQFFSVLLSLLQMDDLEAVVLTHACMRVHTHKYTDIIWSDCSSSHSIIHNN